MQKCQKIFILLFEVLTYPIHAGSSSEYPIFNSMYIKLLITFLFSPDSKFCNISTNWKL